MSDKLPGDYSKPKRKREKPNVWVRCVYDDETTASKRKVPTRMPRLLHVVVARTRGPLEAGDILAMHGPDATLSAVMKNNAKRYRVAWGPPIIWSYHDKAS